MSSINSKILVFANSKLGKKVDRGECWDLAFLALKYAGAKTPSGGFDGDSSDPKLYIWSSKTKNYAGSIPGDIIQYNNYKFSISAKNEPNKGEWSGMYEYQLGVPQHTQILKSKGSNGEAFVYEQNWSDENGNLIKKVAVNRNFINPGEFYISRAIFKEIFKGECPDPLLERIKIVVKKISGHYTIFRPEKKDEQASLIHKPNQSFSMMLPSRVNKKKIKYLI